MLQNESSGKCNKLHPACRLYLFFKRHDGNHISLEIASLLSQVYCALLQNKQLILEMLQCTPKFDPRKGRTLLLEMAI